MNCKQGRNIGTAVPVVPMGTYYTGAASRSLPVFEYRKLCVNNAGKEKAYERRTTDEIAHDLGSDQKKVSGDVG